MIVKQFQEGDITLREALTRSYSNILITALYTVVGGGTIPVKPTSNENRTIRRTLKSLKDAGYLRMVWTGPRTVKFLPTQKLLEDLKMAAAELYNRPARQLLVERLLKRLKALYEEAQDEDRSDKGNIH